MVYRLDNQVARLGAYFHIVIKTLLKFLFTPVCRALGKGQRPLYGVIISRDGRDSLLNKYLLCSASIAHLTQSSRRIGCRALDRGGGAQYNV